MRPIALAALTGLFALGAVASLGGSPGTSRADAAPLAFHASSGDLDHAHGAFEPFRNTLDAAPMSRDASAKERPPFCADFSWPNLPMACVRANATVEWRRARIIPIHERQ